MTSPRASTSAPEVVRGASATTVAVCDHAARTYRTGHDVVVAVTDLTAEVPADARWAITGPSGSGKSTVLHLLAGLDRPTSGAVTWPALGGHPLDGPGRAAMVFQGPSLMPQLTALENVAFALQVTGCADADAAHRAHVALEHLGLSDLAGTLPAQMSGGQAQRVAIARVLAARPRLILADEPTGQLDHHTAQTVLDVLIAAADDIGAALLVSTHDPAVAERFATRWTMHAGCLRPDHQPARVAGGLR